jgi:anti-sigma factor ChrR (cupin superfamily)
MKDERPPNEIHTLAAAYALGALDEPEARQFEAHLNAGCAECVAEVRAFEATVHQLAFNSPPAQPRPQVRVRLMARLAPNHTSSEMKPNPQIWKAWNRTPDLSKWVVRSTEGQWQETGISGVTAKNLFVDSEHQCVTMLVRMTPGSHYPRHRHADTEQCYVIQGDLHVGDQSYQSGDYIRAGAGSMDEDIYTATGCLLFIVSSQHDELLTGCE